LLSSVLEFVGLLRRAGVRVAQSEVGDFLEALRLTGMDRDNLLWAMQAALIKEEAQRPVLESLFDLFWERGRLPRGFAGHPPVVPADAPRLDPEVFQLRLQVIKDYISSERSRLSGPLSGSCRAGAVGAGPGSGRGTGRPGSGASNNPGSATGRFVSAVLEGSPEKMRRLAREAMRTLPVEDMEDQDFLRQMKKNTGWAGGEELLRKMAGDKTVQAMLGRGLEERLEQFRRVVAAERNRVTWEKDPGQVADRLNAARTSFSRLDYLQSREIAKKLLLLGRRLATRQGYRYVPSPRGKVDLRRTAALAGRLGRVPASLLRRQRKPDRPEVVVLCDLSGSVAPFSRFMLLLAGAMQYKFRLCRSFAFVDAVEEVTGLSRGWDAENKIAGILRQTRIWQTGFSDYGAVWRQFGERYAGVVGPKTNLIILGDARNNYKPAGADDFAGIAASARRVIWLNPAPADQWNSEDSIMDTYRPYCDAVLECRNLEQLARVARHVFN